MSEELKTKTATEGDAVTDITIPADLQEKLAEYGADNDTMKKIVCDLGVEGLDDLTSMEVEDLVGAGMKLAKARKLLSAMKTPAKPAAATVPSAVETRAIQDQFEALLPAIPTDESWLNALKTGGILKVDESSYIAAIRAALTGRSHFLSSAQVFDPPYLRGYLCSNRRSGRQFHHREPPQGIPGTHPGYSVARHC